MSFLKIANGCLFASIAATLVSLVLLVYPGLILSIEFTGGTLMELALPESVTREQLLKDLQAIPETMPLFTNASVTRTRTGTSFVRSSLLTNDQHLALTKQLKTTYPTMQELQFTTIGPTVSQSLKTRALIAIVIASIALITYLAFAFRKIPKQLSPWKVGAVTVIAVLHDIAITVGIFTILSHVTSFQADTLFVSALLSIMGYSVNDTIVIFDRIRDNLITGNKGESFTDLAVRSLKQSLSRTLSTGIAMLTMLTSLFIFGSESIRWFVLTLVLGTVIGTYSSFFVATPLLIFLKKKALR